MFACVWNSDWWIVRDHNIIHIVLIKAELLIKNNNYINSIKKMNQKKTHAKCISA